MKAPLNVATVDGVEGSVEELVVIHLNGAAAVGDGAGLRGGPTGR